MTAPAPVGSVSVVVVNFRGTDDTLACVASLDTLDWPADRLEIVVVDNGSGGDHAARLHDAFGGRPGVRLVLLGENTGFTGGCNAGAEAATGDVLAFLNNDAKPDPGWLREAVAVLEADPAVASVASRVLDSGGTHVDFVGGTLAWYGYGFKTDVGAPTSIEDAGRAQDVLFGTGSALLVRAPVFAAVGGFDERYFMFFEDVDLGWRLWLLGHRVRYVPTSVVRHKHHGSVAVYGPWREEYLLSRNALATIYKNYSDDALAAVLPGAMALTVRRALEHGGDDPHALDLAHGAVADTEPATTVSKSTLAGAYAVDGFLELLPSLSKTRAELQAARVRPDAQVLALFGKPVHPDLDTASFMAAHTAAVDAFGVREVFPTRRRVLIVTAEAVTDKMAGPAIRAWQLAQVTGQRHDVRLASVSVCDVAQGPGFTVHGVGTKGLNRLARWAEVVVAQGDLLTRYPALADPRLVVVADAYDPAHLEQLEQARDAGEAGRRETVQATTSALNDQLLRADLVLCASDKQRDLWLGQLAALGRVNPRTYDDDPTLRRLVDVVPFGLPDHAPVAPPTPVMRGVLPGVGPDDEVLLWGGGIYNWFDPLTLVRAVDVLRRSRPQVRLVFMGLDHPNPQVPRMRMAARTLELAQELGILGTHVIASDGWVPYDERQGWLLEADLGVTTHLDHVETAFSFRTRVLDYLWAGLPVVTTDGDAMARLVGDEDLGAVVPPGDVAALADALEGLLADPERRRACAQRVTAVAPRFRWSAVAQPLTAFLDDPRRAPDLLDAPSVAGLRRPVTPPSRPWTGWRGDVALAREYLRDGGVREVAHRVSGRLRTLTGR